MIAPNSTIARGGLALPAPDVGLTAGGLRINP